MLRGAANAATSLGAARGARDDTRKCMRGKGTRFMVMSFRSVFKLPSNLTLLVKCSNRFAAMPFMASHAFALPPTAAVLGPKPGPLMALLAAAVPLLVAASKRLAMLSRAWFSTGRTQLALLTRQEAARTALYGLVTTSSSSDGKIGAEKRNTSGNSSSKSPSRYVPSPLPVPPPSECSNRKPCSESASSAARLNCCSSGSLYWGP
eukprot:GHRR01028918.1.p1 GENE.GHRR01028918.1~~GHRR01028918.1.p1  ORF type:complete len:206 (-),score=46.81 GHRR01028918.1:120-737(-)